MKKTVIKLVLFFLAIVAFSNLNAKNPNFYRILFYNVENLFDTFNDSLISDEEFTPQGNRHWTTSKYEQKLKRVYQTVIRCGNGELPAIIGLCEVENRGVLTKLLTDTPLGQLGYKIVHKESPDRRGIDVALLYNDAVVTPIYYEAIPLEISSNPDFRSRDILYFKAKILSDTVHIYVNHWPSKYGGALASEPFRLAAASTLQSHASQLMNASPECKIIMMGDFNDMPNSACIIELTNDNGLVNLTENSATEGKGTIKYKGKWQLIDQFIVSPGLLFGKGLITAESAFKIHSYKFLLEPDKANLGMKPFRTYLGYKYHNGFSDHLPVSIDLFPIRN